MLLENNDLYLFKYTLNTVSKIVMLVSDMLLKKPNSLVHEWGLIPNPLKIYQTLTPLSYTLFHEKDLTFFSNIIGLPERRNKRKSVLEINKMYYF